VPDALPRPRDGSARSADRLLDQFECLADGMRRTARMASIRTGLRVGNRGRYLDRSDLSVRSCLADAPHLPDYSP